jgi:ABC-2 type transport system permease protein
VDAAPGAVRAALGYLIARSLANRVRRRLAQLRRPRYVVALVLGIGYFTLIFWPSSGGGAIGPEATHVIAALVIALFLAWSWLWGGYRNALALTPAETHLLLPAPLSRRALIAFKLVRAQPAILLSTVLLTVISQGGGAPWWLRLPALYVLLATLHLHQTASSLVHAAATEQGRAGARRNRVALVLFVAAVLLLGYALVDALPRLRAAPDVDALLTALGAALREPAARAALLPITLVLEPTLAGSAGRWLRAIGPALLVLALHVVWVFRTDAAFEEGAAAEGARVAAWKSAARQGRRPQSARRRKRPRRSPPVPAFGPPAIALVWKNAVTFVRGMRTSAVALVLILGMTALVAALAITESGGGVADVVAVTALSVAGLLTVMGPLAVRNDLRHDLVRLDLLRTYPLSGRAVVAAEVASSALTLSVVQLAVLAVGLVAATGGARMRFDAAAAGAAFVAALVVLPTLNALALTVQNGLALLFPAWVRIGDVPPGGIEFMGQQLLSLFGALLLLGAGLIVPVAAAAATFALLAALHTVALAVAALVFAALLAAEVVALIALLGRTFDRTDPADAGIVSA